MKKILIGLTLVMAIPAFSGVIKISEYDSGDIILTFSGEEAKEVFNKISKKEELRSSFSGGFLSGKTYVKNGKDITCTREKYFPDSEEEFTCTMSVDHKGRVDGV